MNIFLIVLSGLTFILVVYLLIVIKGQMPDSEEGIEDVLEQQDQVTEELDKLGREMGNIREGMGVVKEMGRQIGDIRDLMRSPKLRGGFGEGQLESLLGNYLPKDHFTVQYQFEDSKTVDAVVDVGDRLVPIDSKFPIDDAMRVIQAETEEEEEKAYKKLDREARKYIRSVKKKYIRPDEGTTNFAFIFVPSEAVWYEIVRNDEKITKYAQDQNVYLLSPHSFHYAMQILRRAMQGREFQRKIHKIQSMLETVENQFGGLKTELDKLGKHLSNAKSAMERVKSKFSELAQKIKNVSQIKAPEKDNKKLEDPGGRE